MELDRIERLLEKFWDCRTSVEEEKELKAFFNSGAVPEQWQVFTPLFRYYKEEGQRSHLGEHFDEQLLTRIANESGTGAAAGKSGKVIRIFYDVAKVAAVGLILFTAAYFVREEYVVKRDEMDTYIADTFENPQVAFEETKKALMLISRNFNKGREEALKLGVFNEAREKVKETDTGQL